MDYSPTPGKVKPQYAFLDDSIEIGRSEVSKPFKSSPLKNQYQFQNQNEKDSETFHHKQKQFFNKYRDLTSAGDSPDLSKQKQKARSNYQQTTSDTTSRLFKNIGNKVPVDDVVKINSNMIEKIIRENESLKTNLKEERKENQILNGFANGLKEKLVKYKRLNDDLKFKNEELISEKKDLEQKVVQLETKQKETEVELTEAKKSLNFTKAQVQSVPESPKYNFDPENVQDIFNGVNDDEDVNNAQNNIKESPKVQFATTKIEERIQNLENEVSKINTNQDSKFDYIKNEIEFLKNLSLQVQTKQVDEPVTNDSKDLDETSPKEDELIVKESLELKELQQQVDIVTKKLQLREQNKIKKYELNKELEKLALQLKHDDIPQFTNQQPLQQIHTAEKQKSSPPSSTKIHTPSQQQQQQPRSNPKLDSIRERLQTKDCFTCNETLGKDATPERGANEPRHIPSFKIGDTVWH
ncbi:hypothetical protein BN7_2744 [Wickerhamomyces ciferrii]|uniref:Uncharacterized protein n=1 Tax=Wickerhamomyces ciferrii (strain ATCC 14091 / BCRC 22168 / CBS 111 / JCM 3599 / NBRC 0793 / NRRL Y-1031 F-60-10) TaxID=1206466 RepID=K0KLW5_WICCF|nr:uncharacterized protein BN7_2744 [Wickerhamomyces ciferrii]CCH43197.1 hypothetical protein BN7_2744 [Wickerhamomyces ciferrii]